VDWGGSSGRGVALTTHILMLRLRKEWSYNSTLLVGSVACYKVKFAFTYNTNTHIKTLEDWIHFVLDKDKGLDFVNTIMKLWVPNIV
jgi:hypothetical protein